MNGINKKNIFKIYLIDALVPNASHGAEIFQEGATTFYLNHWLPSGHTIAMWGNNQVDRGFNNNLPIIFPGDEFAINSNVKIWPKDSLLLKFTLINDFKSKKIIKSIHDEFIKFPFDFKFHSVKLELINFSNDETRFNEIIFEKVTKI